MASHQWGDVAIHVSQGVDEDNGAYRLSCLCGQFEATGASADEVSEQFMQHVQSIVPRFHSTCTSCHRSWVSAELPPTVARPDQLMCAHGCDPVPGHVKVTVG